MTVIEQAQRYVAAIPPAVSGDSGHNQTFSVAMALVEGFGLSTSDARSLLAEYSARCSPPWSEREIEHKLQSAEQKIDPSKRGSLIRKGVRYTNAYSALVRNGGPVQPVVKPPAKSVRYEVSDSIELPDPLQDGTRLFLRTAFAEGEGIRIAIARHGDDGREQPRDAGVTLSREEWLRKLDEHDGRPNGFLKTSERNGIFISVNPMKIGGSRDADVTCFRHALLEFDGISLQEQWGLITQSRIPCTAVVSSGRKSIHAWVRVDAQDRRSFDERVKILYQHFAEYQPDEKNKNPSRFSRLPNCERGTSRQELLSMAIGCESFTEWIRINGADDLGPCHRFSDLLSVDTSKDPNCVIGFRDGKTLRYLCKGKSGWLIGPSGIGKSSLIAEFAIAWALGLPAFGIEPARPLRSLIVQAENDFFDLAEMAQGISKAHGISKESIVFEDVEKNVIFKTETTSIREEFVRRLHRLIDRERPDVVWADPLLSFAGIKVSEQDECSMFLRQWLNPVLEATGIVLLGVHHTGKPRNARDTAGWTALDWAYSGLGSSELVNWARAVMVLKPIDDHNFELKFAKRGYRAGAKHPDGAFTTSIFLQHGQSEIRWHQQPPPEAPAEDTGEKKKGPKSKVAAIAASNLSEVLAACPKEGESANAIGKRLHKFSRKVGKTLGETKCRTDLLDALVENGKLSYSEKNELYFKGKNA